MKAPRRRAEVKLSGLPSEFPFVLVLAQSVLEDLLEKKLQERGGIKVHWNHRLADLAMRDGAAAATIEEMALTGKGYIVPGFEFEVKRTVSVCADFVVGADGQNSAVRQRLGIASPIGRGTGAFHRLRTRNGEGSAAGNEHRPARTNRQRVVAFRREEVPVEFSMVSGRRPGRFPSERPQPFHRGGSSRRQGPPESSKKTPGGARALVPGGRSRTLAGERTFNLRAAWRGPLAGSGPGWPAMPPIRPARSACRA